MSDPKAEQWAETVWIDLLNSVIAIDIRDEDAIKAVLARHAPKPEDQPIRVGNCVQVTNPESPAYRCMGQVCEVHADGQISFGFWAPNYNNVLIDFDVTLPAGDFTRLGRAAIDDDGNPVED